MRLVHINKYRVNERRISNDKFMTRIPMRKYDSLV